MSPRWINTPHVGRSGFVQAYLKYHVEVAEIQYHAPQFIAQFYTHKMRPAQLPEGFHYFDTIEDAKAWAVAVARMNITFT